MCAVYGILKLTVRVATTSNSVTNSSYSYYGHIMHAQYHNIIIPLMINIVPHSQTLQTVESDKNMLIIIILLW